MLFLILRIWQSVLTLVSRVGQIQRDIADLKAAQAAIAASLQIVQAQLEQILDQLVTGPAVELIFTAELEGQITVGVTAMNMEDSQLVTLTIQPVDKKKNPAPVDGIPVWLSSNTEVVTVVAAADGMSAVATAVGPLGTATVSVTADADLGAGVTEIAGTLDFTIIAGAAAAVTIVAGTPTEQDQPQA